MLRMHAGQVTRTCARMIAAAVAQRFRIVMVKTGEHEEIVAMCFQRLQNAREVESQPP